MKAGGRERRGGDRGRGREERGERYRHMWMDIHKTYSKHFDFNSPALCRQM